MKQSEQSRKRWFSFADYSLRVKLIVAFLVVALLPLAGLAVVNRRITQNVVIGNADQALLAAASQTAAALDNFISTNLSAVRVESRLSLWSNYLVLSSGERANSPLAAEVQTTLNDLSRKNQIFTSALVPSYALLDAQGVNVIDTHAGGVGQNKFDEAYFQDPFQTGQPYVSPVLFLNEDQAVMYFSSVVRDGAGTAVGVLRIRYNATVLQQLVLQNSGLAGEQSFGSLYDEYHVRLADVREPDLVFKSVVPLAADKVAELQTVGRLPGGTAVDLATNLPEFESALSNVVAKPIFSGVVHTEEEAKEAAIVQLQTRPWLVVFEQPRSVFLEPLGSQAEVALVIMGLGIVAVVIASVLVAQVLAQPLLRLTAVTQKVASGDLTVQASENTRDEVGTLAQNFNTMTNQLSSVYASLEDRVQARTKELEKAMEVLAVTRDEAKEANRAKSVFLANMSHELRTPLNAIIGYSEMLEEDAVDFGHDDMAEDLQKVLRAARHLLGMINDVLDISKIEAGKMTLYLETFDVQNLVGSVVDTVRPLMDQKANQLVVMQTGSLGDMNADITKVRQVLLNLLSNAAKFTDNDAVTLTVERQAIGDLDYLQFQVADKGIGMSDEQIAGLFQAFTQADDSITRKYGGTGLGLAICKHYCEMMGGDIMVESELGYGSTFIVTLPADVGLASTTLSPPSASLTRPSSIRPTQEIETVLIIDDDPATHDVIRAFLERTKITTVSAFNGEEGLQLAQQIRPHLILLDIMMPVMDGWTVLAKLKAMPDLADIPVVIASMTHERNTGFILGAAEYITKPFDKNELLTIVNKYRCQNGECEAMVVEDDDSSREVMRSILQKDGWQVVEAINGRVALTLVAQNQPDIILLDLMMPEMDGFEFASRLQAKPEWRDIPIIVVTAKDLTSEDLLRLNGYVERIIQKGSYTHDQLLDEIHQLITYSVSEEMVVE